MKNWIVCIGEWGVFVGGGGEDGSSKNHLTLTSWSIIWRCWKVKEVWEDWSWVCGIELGTKLTKYLVQSRRWMRKPHENLIMVLKYTLSQNFKY